MILNSPSGCHIPHTTSFIYCIYMDVCVFLFVCVFSMCVRAQYVCVLCVHHACVFSFYASSACVRARARACVRACVCVCVFLIMLLTSAQQQQLKANDKAAVGIINISLLFTAYYRTAPCHNASLIQTSL